MLHEDGVELIALVEERGGIGVGAERRTIEQLAKPEDRAHRKGEIAVLVQHLRQQTTEHWLSILDPADVWCSDVLTWDRLFAHEAFQALEMIQNVDNRPDRKSTRLNSSHLGISYAVF